MNTELHPPLVDGRTVNEYTYSKQAREVLF